MPVTIPPRPADTSVEAERVQIDLLRKAPVSRRLHLAWSLSATVISVARRALARAQPHASQQDLDLRSSSWIPPTSSDEKPDGGFFVASAEDTVLAKLEWFRLGGETSERQWWDIVGVLRVGAGADRAYMNRWSAALGVSDLLERALADAGD